MEGYKKLIVWQKSLVLVKKIYKIIDCFPKIELYNLVSQIRRSVISIPLNIAEGYGRKNKKEKAQFFNIAYASGIELEAQLEISKELNYINDLDLQNVKNLLEEINKILYVYREKIYDSV